MDDNIHEIHPKEFPTANLLSGESTLEDTLHVTIERYDGPYKNGERFRKSIRHGKELSSNYLVHKVNNLEHLFCYEYENEAITNFFMKDDIMHSAKLQFSNILRSENNTQDVIFRQQGVKELIKNKDLASQVQKIISNRREMFTLDGHVFRQMSLNVKSQFTPERLKSFLDDVEALENYNPHSGPILNAISWVKQLREDTLFRELFAAKRKITDSRIFVVYSERYNDVQYGVLKPGIKPEEVFDFISEDLICKEYWDPYDREIDTTRWNIAKHKTRIDEITQKKIFVAARQKMDQVNEMTADHFMTQTLLVHLQLEQLYQGIAVASYFKKNRFPMTFPEIDAEKGYIEARKVMPLRLLLDNMWIPKKLKEFCYNDFRFTPEDRIIQIEGPNNSGKSEAWRTIHLMNYFINAGYPVPAEYCRWSVFPQSHFITCKGNCGNGGSELENSKKQIFEKLAYVRPGDLVILDEFGDATNQYTAKVIGDMTIDPLLENNCKILITSHHDALTKSISEKYGGRSLMPDPEGSGVGKYRLIPIVKDKTIDYKANEVLEGIGWTKESVKNIIGTGDTIRSYKEEEEMRKIDDDLPF